MFSPGLPPQIRSEERVSRNVLSAGNSAFPESDDAVVRDQTSYAGLGVADGLTDGVVYPGLKIGQAGVMDTDPDQ